MNERILKLADALFGIIVVFLIILFFSFGLNLLLEQVVYGELNFIKTIVASVLMFLSLNWFFDLFDDKSKGGMKNDQGRD